MPANLRLRGLQGYSARSAHGANSVERQRTVGCVRFKPRLRPRDAFAHAGLATEILTGGSTGTWDIDTLLAEVTELQAGSYVLMDIEYGEWAFPFKNAP